MTCIIGLVEDGKVYMGGDRAGVDGWNRRAVSTSKVFRLGEFLIGFTTSFRMGQILRYQTEIRHQQDGEDNQRYMVVAFAESVRESLKAKGFAEIEGNKESGGELLIGYRGQLYLMASDFQVTEFTRPFNAIGSGAPFALGAMQALTGCAPEAWLLRSLAITAELCVDVSEPFDVEVL